MQEAKKLKHKADALVSSAFLLLSVFRNKFRVRNSRLKQMSKQKNLNQLSHVSLTNVL